MNITIPKQFLLFACSLTVCAVQAEPARPNNVVEAARLPDFSWDTVPRYMHVRKVTAFTPKEVKYLSSFPLITFEKTTGNKQFGSSEAGTIEAAKAVKQLNPNSKILYYRNIIVHYGTYAANQGLKAIDGAFLVNAQGNDKLVRNHVEAYDLTNPKIQSWWLDNAKEVCSSPYIDGVFVDGNIKALVDGYLKRDVGVKKKAAVKKSYNKMMKALPKAIGPDKLVLANIIRARFDDSGLNYLNYFDGSYLEAFEHNVGGVTREDYMVKGLAAMQAAAKNGKIIAFTIGMGANRASSFGIDEARGTVNSVDAVKARFDYGLGLFLVSAGKYSYFMPHDGYGADNGKSKFWLKDIPEFGYRLGAPLGPAKKKGYVYTRNFKHAKVWVDLESEKAKIVWDDAP